jgi:hypothetical protein
VAPGKDGCLIVKVGGMRLDTAGTPLALHGRNVHDALADRTGGRPGPASTPSGERISRQTFYLAPDPPAPNDDDEPVAEEPVPEPSVDGAERPMAPAGRTSPDGPPEAHGPPSA